MKNKTYIDSEQQQFVNILKTKAKAEPLAWFESISRPSIPPPPTENENYDTQPPEDGGGRVVPGVDETRKRYLAEREHEKMCGISQYTISPDYEKFLKEKSSRSKTKILDKDKFTKRYIADKKESYLASFKVQEFLKKHRKQKGDT